MPRNVGKRMRNGTRREYERSRKVNSSSVGCVRFLGRRMVLDLIPPKVVNRHYEAYDVYCGRGTPWGNPYSHDRRWVSPDKVCASRDEAVEMYRLHFYKCLHTVPGFAEQTRSLAGMRIACSCKPARCHCDIIVEWFELGCPMIYPGCTD